MTPAPDAAAAAGNQPPAAAAAAATLLAGKLAVSTSRIDTASPFQYAPESIQQVRRMQALQERVAELEQALMREQDRSKLLQTDLSRLRQQHQWCMSGSGGGGSSGGSTPSHRTSHCNLNCSDHLHHQHAACAAAAGSAFVDAPPSHPHPHHPASPFHAATAGAMACAPLPPPLPPATGFLSSGLPAAATSSCIGASGHGAASAAAAAGEVVVVSRQALELLHLKERAMDAAKEGIVIADCSQPDMPLIYANEGFSRMTGYDATDVLGRNCRFLQNPPAGASNPAQDTNDAAVWELRQAINAGLPCVVQLMNYKRNGDAFVNYLSLNPIHDANERLTHYVGVQSDITELVNHRKAELAAKHVALQAAAATEAKSQFLARMSHEIRTPLNGMIAVGQLLADTPLSPAQWDLVNTIRCSGETLLTLITDILDFSRIEANKMVLSHAEFRLQTVIEAAMEIAGLHAAQKRLQVAYNVAQSVPSIVVGDAQRLQQILLNILNNAVKFTEAGEILLEVWAEEDEEEEEQQQLLQQQQGEATGVQAAAGTHAAAGAKAEAKAAAGGERQGVAAAAAAAAALGQHPRPAAKDDDDQQAQAQQVDGLVAAAAADGSAADASAVAAAAAAAPLPAPACGGATRSLLLQFSVRDTGIGISKENISRLFQSFSQVDASPTRRHGGSGLGLAICLRLCEAMGGRMWAESGGCGEGSLFRWCIRVRMPEPKGLKQQQQPGNGASSSRGGSAPVSGRSSLERRSSGGGGCGGGGCGGGSSSRSSLERSVRSSLERVVSGVQLPLLLSPAAPPPPAAAAVTVGVLHEQAAMRVLHGRRVLLVEPCPMVRQVLTLALLRWGCAVCAVGSESAGMARLRMAGSSDDGGDGGGGGGDSGTLCSPPLPVSPSLAEDQAQRQLQQQEGQQQQHAIAPDGQLQQRQRGAAAQQQQQHHGRHVHLEHAAPLLEADYQADGPYDVVIMDMMLQNLLQALMLCAHASEAQRVIFMGWPGQNEPDGPADSGGTGGTPGGMHASSALQASLAHRGFNSGDLQEVRGSGLAAQPPRMLTEQLAYSQAPGQRQLGYVVVTRPMRQGRLRLALEEVLTMQLDSSDDGGGGGDGDGAGVHSHPLALLPGGGAGGGGAFASAAQQGFACGSDGGGGGGGSDGGGGGASSLGSRASSSSNLRCAGATLVRATQSSCHLADAVAASGAAPLRLLLAEDNAINMKVALGILKRMGCTNIVTAEDGEAAVEALHVAGGPDAFDVILMDLHMPKKGGMEAVRDIRRTWSHYKTKIIAVTADAFEDTRDNCIAAGFHGWLAKPFRVEEFARVLSVCRSGGALTPDRR